MNWVDWVIDVWLIEIAGWVEGFVNEVVGGNSTDAFKAFTTHLWSTHANKTKVALRVE
jgi:hypothetical protein